MQHAGFERNQAEAEHEIHDAAVTRAATTIEP
jgi:hypothetical protein